MLRVCKLWNGLAYVPVWNWALSPRTEMEDDKRLLLTSLTEIGVRGVNELPTKQNKTEQNLTNKIKSKAKSC